MYVYAFLVRSEQNGISQGVKRLLLAEKLRYTNSKSMYAKHEFTSFSTIGRGLC